MSIKYFDVAVVWNGESYNMVYPARTESSAWKKALEDINDSWVVPEELFRSIATVALRESLPETKYKYVSHYYGINPVIGTEFQYAALGEYYGATVVAPEHDDVASVFFIKDGDDVVMRMHPLSYKDAISNQEARS